MMTEKELSILTGRVTNKVLETTPIISIPNPPSLTPLGCGIFLKNEQDYYLISAGHLLNLKDWPALMVPGNDDKMVMLRGTIVTTFENDNTECEIDFGVVKFAETQIKHLINGKLSFINSDDIIVNHKVEQNGYYVIAGYPITGVKKTSGKREYKPIPVKFLTHPTDENKYEKYNFNPDHFILVNYARKIAPFNSTEKQITKKLTGISGSGLWYVPDWRQLKDGIPKCYLVGIMTENYKEKGFLVALKIDFVTQLIKDGFDSEIFEDTNFELKNSIKTLYHAENK